MELDSKRDAKIDEMALDVEWLEQSELMRRYTHQLADLRYEMEKAAKQVELTKSQVYADIRANPQDHGLTKVTEAVLNSAVIQDDRYQAAVEESLRARRAHDRAAGDVRAISHRKAALENLVFLHGQSYFAGPQAPRDLSRERQSRRERERASNDAVSSRTSGRNRNPRGGSTGRRVRRRRRNRG